MSSDHSFTRTRIRFMNYHVCVFERHAAESNSNRNSGIYRRRHRCLSHHRETMTTPGKPSAHTAEKHCRTCRTNIEAKHAAKLFVTELGTGIFTLLPSGNVSRGSVSQRSSIQAFDIAFPHTCNEFFKGDIPVFRLRNRDGIYVKRLNTTPCLSYSIEYSVSHFIWNAIRISA